MAVYSAFSKCLIPPVPNQPQAANKNWNPGIYIESGNTGSGRNAQWSTPGNNNPSTRGIVQRLQADTAGKIKGAMLRFTWTELEGNTLGSYTAGMDMIQSYLDQIAAFQGRRLIVFIALKTFGTNDHAVPLYMQNSATYADGEDYYMTRNGVRTQGSYNGEYVYESDNGGAGGRMPNMHVPAVRARWDALMTEFAARFNNNPYLEGVVYSEASIGQPVGSVGAANETVGGVVITRPNTDGSTWHSRPTWASQMTTSFVNQRASLSNIQICQWINDRQISAMMVPGLRAAGIGFGMTDTCPEEKSFNYRNDIPGQGSTNPGNIQHCQESNGLAMIMCHGSVPSMNGQVANRCATAGTLQGQPHVYPAYPGVMTSRQAIRDFAVNTVGCTHYVIIHNTGNQPVTGAIDPAIPNSCAQNPYTAYSNYGGQTYNKNTDDWIQNPASNITTVTTRPTGW